MTQSLQLKLSTSNHLMNILGCSGLFSAISALDTYTWSSGYNNSYISSASNQQQSTYIGSKSYGNSFSVSATLKNNLTLAADWSLTNTNISPADNNNIAQNAATIAAQTIQEIKYGVNFSYPFSYIK